MRSANNLAGILKIRLRIHYSWAIAFVFIIAVVVTHFPEVYPLWEKIVFGAAAGLLFFVSVAAREFLRSFVVINRGIPVKSITLLVFGGVLSIAKEATSPILELLVAVAGPLSSLIVAIAFYLVYVLLIITGNVIVAGLIQWLVFINLMLAFLHIVPGFPLDGGRVFRAVLWRTTGDYEQVTRIATWTGQGTGLLLIAGGVVELVITRQWFVGLVLAGVGLVLHNAAAQVRRLAMMSEALQGVTVRDIMSKECPLVSQQLSLGQLVRDFILITGQPYLVVVDGLKLMGIVTVRNIKSIPRERWDSTRITEIMTPAQALKIAHPDQSAASLLEQMNELGISQMPVLEEDRVVGIVARDNLIRLGRTRARFGV